MTIIILFYNTLYYTVLFYIAQIEEALARENREKFALQLREFDQQQRLYSSEQERQAEESEVCTTSSPAHLLDTLPIRSKSPTRRSKFAHTKNLLVGLLHFATF